VAAAFATPLAQALGALSGVLRSPNLRRLELAYAASLIGLWAYSVAIVIYAFELGGATLVGVSAVVRLLPAAVAAPFAAMLADRHSRRRVMLVTDLVRSLLVAAIAVSVAADLPATVVFSLAGAMAVVSTAFEPAKNALLPSLVADPDQLTAANVATSTLESSAIFAGPALGGVVFALASAEAALAVTAGLLLCSAALLARIEAAGAHEPVVNAGDGPREEGLVAELLGGGRAIAADWRLALVMGLLSAQLLVDGAIGVFVVVIALDVLELGRGAVGLLDSAAGLGGLVGALAALAVIGQRGLAATFGFGVAAWGAPLLLIAAWPEPAVAFAAFGLVGVANTVVDSSGFTLLQRASPDELRGRVFGVFETLAIMAVGLGSLIASVLIAALDTVATLVVVGAFLPTLALVAWPALRRLDAETPMPGPETDLLRGIPMFAPLAPASLEQLASQLERLRFPAGSVVIRQGDPGDRFYVIEDGEVEVFEDGVRVRRQGVGDFFGEIALVRDMPRTATVVAHTDLELLALEREPFIATVTGHARTREAADAVIRARLGSVRAGAGSV
jgi:MFS family permease